MGSHINTSSQAKLYFVSYFRPCRVCCQSCWTTMRTPSWEWPPSFRWWNVIPALLYWRYKRTLTTREMSSTRPLSSSIWEICWIADAQSMSRGKVFNILVKHSRIRSRFSVAQNDYAPREKNFASLENKFGCRTKEWTVHIQKAIIQIHSP